jgi:hypothetical protein
VASNETIIVFVPDDPEPGSSVPDAVPEMPVAEADVTVIVPLPHAGTSAQISFTKLE